MAEAKCASCSFRKKFDNAPKSLPGRLWRWHTGWCPGWKKYMAALPEEERIKIAEHYGMEKFKG